MQLMQLMHEYEVFSTGVQQSIVIDCIQYGQNHGLKFMLVASMLFFCLLPVFNLFCYNKQLSIRKVFILFFYFFVFSLPMLRDLPFYSSFSLVSYLFSHFDCITLFLQIILIISQSHKHLRVMKDQTSQDANTKSPYQFCYTENKPSTLVMLKKGLYMKDMIKRKSYFAVIKASYFDTKQAESLSQQTKSTVKIFETVKSAYTFAKKYEEQVSMYIICSSEHRMEINQRRQIQKRINKQMKYEKVKFCELNDKQSIEKMISQKSQYPSNKLFASFISQRNRISKSNRLVENMIAMLNQQLDHHTTQKVLDFLKNLLELLKQADLQADLQQEYNYEIIEEDIDKLLLEDLMQEDIIKMYTKDTHFDKLINSLLRSSDHSTEVFYIHPFFQKLFNTIIQKFNETKQKSKIHPSVQAPNVLFRGGISCQQQIRQLRQSVGNLIQNLTFMSTSMNLKTAWQFKKGYIKSMTIITIVDQEQQATRQDNQSQLCRSFNFGYCDISQHSQFKNEKEFLFNPLNSFELYQFKQIFENKCDEWPVQIEIKLRKVAGKISKKQQITNNQLSKIQLQGHVLVDKQLNQHGCSDYWRQFYKIAVNTQHKVQALINLIYIDNNQRKFKDAILKAQQCQKILSEARAKGRNKKLQAKYVQIQQLMLKIYEKNYQHKKALEKWKNYEQNIKKQPIQQHYTFILKAHILNGLGMYDQAIDLYKKSIEQLEKLIDKKNLKNYLRYLEVFEALSVALKNNGNNKEAYEILRKCNNKKLEILGEDHPCYLNSLQNEANIQGEQFLLKVNLQKSMKCLMLRQFIYGKSHLLCLSSQNSIATNLFSQRQFNKSLSILLSCKVKYEQIGERNMQYLNVLHNISCIYLNQKKNVQALTMIEQCINLRGQIIQKQHFLYVRDLNTKAQMLYQFSRFEECLSLSKQIISITSKNLRINHPFNLQVRLRIAKSHDKLNQQAAYQQYKRCSTILIQFHHDHRIFFINTLHVLDFFRRKQKFHKSLPLLEKFFKISGSLEQKYYKSIVTTFMPIYFHIYERLGMYQEVKKIFKMKENFTSKQYKQQWVIFACYNFFLLYIKLGDYGQAFFCLKKYLILLKQTKVVNLKKLMPTYQMLNQIFIEQKKFVNSSNLQIYHLNLLDQGRLEKNPELLERKKSQCIKELKLTKQKEKSQKKKTRGSKCFIALGST